jgi:hypothetical protein
MTSEDTAAQADVLQAQSMRRLLGEERRANGAKIAALGKRLTASISAGQPDAHHIKRAIRQLENDIQHMDRMLDALTRRFPDSMSDTA